MADRPRKHTEAIVLRFEPEQLEMVDRAAELAGLSRTSWLRALAIRAARQELGEGPPRGGASGTPPSGSRGRYAGAGKARAKKLL